MKVIGSRSRSQDQKCLCISFMADLSALEWQSRFIAQNDDKVIFRVTDCFLTNCWNDKLTVKTVTHRLRSFHSYTATTHSDSVFIQFLRCILNIDSLRSRHVGKGRGLLGLNPQRKSKNKMFWVYVSQVVIPIKCMFRFNERCPVTSIAVMTEKRSSTYWAVSPLPLPLW